MLGEVVTDTNVIAYWFLRTEPFVREVRSLWESGVHALAPAHWEAEFSNVVWGACRAGMLDAAAARVRLDRAATFGILSVAVPELWQGALARSLASGLAVYDTLFVELAAQRGCPLATFDRALLRAFPDFAARPASLL